MCAHVNIYVCSNYSKYMYIIIYVYIIYSIESIYNLYICRTIEFVVHACAHIRQILHNLFFHNYFILNKCVCVYNFYVFLCTG